MTGRADPGGEWIRLERPRLGTRVTFVTDEYFGARERLLDEHEPVFIADRYDDHGKWMDGWETRRRRTPGYDHCVVRLGIPGVIRGFDIDTRHFTGNFPPQASIDACVSDEDVPQSGWCELVPKTELSGDAQHYLSVDSEERYSHVRLNIYPDGGIARLRIFGEIRPDFSGVDGIIDLVAVENGGRALACSDEHYGSMHNLNLQGRGINMGDGWETARRRGPGNDWVILALGQVGTIERMEIDTAHFKGNFPDRASIEAGRFAGAAAATAADAAWRTLLPAARLEADQRHVFDAALAGVGPVSHVRLSIYPDGGVSRLRLFGRIGRDT
jgi:allantoicase